MTNDYSYNEKIDLFLEGKLSEEDHMAFIQSLRTDGELANMIRIQKVANKIIRTKQLLRLKEKMEADLSRSSWLSSLNSLWLISLVALITGAGLYWYFNAKENNKEEKKYLSNASIMNSDTTPFSKPIIAPATSGNKINKEKVQVTNPTIKDSMQWINIPIIESPIIPNPITEKQNTGPLPVIAPAMPSGKKVVDCSSFGLSNAIKTYPSCQDEPTGKISINVSEITGGTSPYLISVSKIASSFTDKADFLYVKSGNYLVSIKDKNECLLKKEIEVEERECAKANVFVFTPEFEKWKIPVKQKKYGTIKILNKSGILVYQSELSYETENYWDGNSSIGQPLETGYYTYRLNYTDGDQESGSVSIMR
jgi:hypothetical protein